MTRADPGMTWVDSVDGWRVLPREPDAAAAALCTGDEARGECVVCRSEQRFVVVGDARNGQVPNLREFLICTGCGLCSRQRALFAALRADLHDRSAPRIALLERFSPLYRRMRSEPWRLHASEYLHPDHRPGSVHVMRRRLVRHRSITRLGFADGSLDAIVHGDVLEHVPDHLAALRECRRVLRPGGVMLFTVPFSADREQSVLRGRLRADGSIEHLQPPEYHGDSLRSGGVYTFHNFAWSLLADMRRAGFAHAQAGTTLVPPLRLLHPRASAVTLEGACPLVLRGVADA